MIQSHSGLQRIDSIRSHHNRVVIVVGLVVSLVLSQARMGSAAVTDRVAVAPFAGKPEALVISKALAARLARTPIDRLIAPGEFVAERSFEPRASEIRRWAYNSAVDAIVVGRVYSKGQDDERTRIVETVIRSGHSGAALSRQTVSSSASDGLAEIVENLARLILGDLGIRDAPGDEKMNDGTPTPVPGSLEPKGEAVGGGASELDSSLTSSGFRSDAPIEISSEEAEIISRNDSRRLIFQRNVHVRQANVSLRSDRLEALYVKGESEPHEMRAAGHVTITQGDRFAKCDRATYQREASRLTCRGHAELIQGCDIVRGESIRFDLAGNHAVVNGAASIVIEPERDEPSGCAARLGEL